MNESIVRLWICLDGRKFKSKLRTTIAVVLEGVGEPIGRLLRPRERVKAWKGREEMEGEFRELLLSLRATDVGFNSLLIQFQMRAFISVRCPEMLVEGEGSFSMSRSYIRKWVAKQMNWTFRRPNSMSKKLPQNWEELGKRLTLQIAYLVRAYNIPEELVVNADQTGVLLMPVGDDKTFAYKGSQNVSVTGRGDKRQISLLLAIAASGDLLHLQAIFQGTTNQVVPGGSNALLLKQNGCHLTKSKKHWSTLETMKDWVDLIYLPWVKKVCEQQ